MGLLNDASVDLGTNAETQTLRQWVAHPNLRIIFTVTETFYRIVANRAAGISSLADLRGKRIGSIANTSAACFASAQELYRTNPEAVWPRISDAIGIEPSVLEQVWETSGSRARWCTTSWTSSRKKSPGSPRRPAAPRVPARSSRRSSTTA
ncbi:ABC transporter substrate-binding protein [Sorangium sp. So ce1099]|uniref:ABC transporter substrate-binding protein n=1 Tax=Sorangium sp. So ce1099 TaxID=3133331 RepID=UPI003F6335B2